MYHQRAPFREELWRRFNETMMRRAEKEQLAYEDMMLKRQVDRWVGERIEDVNVEIIWWIIGTIPDQNVLVFYDLWWFMCGWNIVISLAYTILA